MRLKPPICRASALSALYGHWMQSVNDDIERQILPSPPYSGGTRTPMPHMVDFQLTNSRGLGRVVYCQGLEVPVVILPTVHGEPLLTAQAFYYLEELECIARMSTDAISANCQVIDSELARRCEYIIDNYLFAYSV